MRKRNRWILGLVFALCLGMLACGKGEGSEEILEDLEFQVVPEREVPKELKELILERQEDPFKLSYSADGNLYIVVGFGRKDSGGYSVRVNGLHLTENAVVIDTDLLGPSQKEEASQAPSYPYVVICTKDRPESVVFR